MGQVGPAQMRARTKQFAIRVVKLFQSLPNTAEARIIGQQLLRSATSVGANYRAACLARSKKEFIAKMGIVREETDESVFWLELLQDAGVFRGDQLAGLLRESGELSSIFFASLRTAKGSVSSPRSGFNSSIPQ